MKKHLLLVVLSMLILSTSTLAADVGVSISVGQPGFYGHIDIGSVPQPQLIYQTPVVIQTVPMGVVQRPVYLHVPPGHEKHWNKHCAKYNACGVPVYFVRESWYNNVYVPSYNGHGHGYNGGDAKHGHGGNTKYEYVDTDSSKHGHGKGHNK